MTLEKTAVHIYPKADGNQKKYSAKYLKKKKIGKVQPSLFYITMPHTILLINMIVRMEFCIETITIRR